MVMLSRIEMFWGKMAASVGALDAYAINIPVDLQNVSFLGIYLCHDEN